jgi:hypothetical protein
MIEMADNAYAAKLWMEGKPQREIAEMLGMSGPAPISTAIRAFLLAYSPAFRADPTWNERASFIPAALKAFQKKHGHQPSEFSAGAASTRLEAAPDPSLETFATTLTMDQRMALPLMELPLTVRLKNCLKSGNGFKCIGDVYSMTERQLMRTPNFGKVSLKELRELLSGLGLPHMKTNNMIDDATPPQHTNGDAEGVLPASVLDTLEDIMTRVVRIQATLTALLNELHERD